MRRVVYSPLTGKTTQVLPIDEGGTGKTSKIEAANALGLVHVSKLGQPGGAASLDADGKLLAGQLPSALGSEVLVDGPVFVPVGMPAKFYITNFNKATNYALLPGSGTAVTLGANGEITVTASSTGLKKFTLQGKDFTFTAQTPAAIGPTVLSPVYDALDMPMPVTVVSSAFMMPVGKDFHESTEWQLSTVPDFASIALSEILTEPVTVWSLNSLLSSTVYYVRARYKGKVTGWGAWGPASKFTTAP